MQLLPGVLLTKLQMKRSAGANNEQQQQQMRHEAAAVLRVLHTAFHHPVDEWGMHLAVVLSVYIDKLTGNSACHPYSSACAAVTHTASNGAAVASCSGTLHAVAAASNSSTIDAAYQRKEPHNSIDKFGFVSVSGGVVMYIKHAASAA